MPDRLQETRQNYNNNKKKKHKYHKDVGRAIGQGCQAQREKRQKIARKEQSYDSYWSKGSTTAEELHSTESARSNATIVLHQ